MIDIQKNIVQPMFIRGIGVYGEYEANEDDVSHFVPDFRIEYLNINSIISIEDSVRFLIDNDFIKEEHGRGVVHIVTNNNEVFDCKYTVTTTTGERVYITQQQFDTLMNEYAIKLY